MKTRIALPALFALSLLLTACGTGGGSPAATTPAPTPTPIAAEVNSPEDAASLVIATDPRFEGTTELSPDVIGASQYWEARALDGGAYEITLTIGWGDCPAGCINRHVWVYKVTADGQVTLASESGEPIPAGGVPLG